MAEQVPKEKELPEFKFRKLITAALEQNDQLAFIDHSEAYLHVPI